MMVDEKQRSLAHQARAIYEARLRGILEHSHMDEFVAIEPISGDYFTGHTLSDAIGASRSRHPDRLTHALRVGHSAAVHFGLHIR